MKKVVDIEMDEMIKIYAVVVAYNPDMQRLRNMIKEISASCDGIIICNNSSYDLDLAERNVAILNFGHNKGIAAAQNAGMDYAFTRQADLVIQIDQDSCISSSVIKGLKQSYLSGIKMGLNIGIIGPKIRDEKTGSISVARIHKEKRIKNTNLYEVSALISSGSIISKNLYVKCGAMDESLFIDLVDFEYCWRASKQNFLIVVDPSVVLDHTVGEGEMKFAGVKTRLSKPIRNYYQFRNYILLVKRKYPPGKWKFFTGIKLIIKFVFVPIFQEHGLERLKFMVKGISDGINHKTGKINL